MTFIISKVEKSILKCFFFAPLLIAFFFFQTKDAAAAVKMHNTGSLLPMGLGGKELTLGPMWLIPQTEQAGREGLQVAPRRSQNTDLFKGERVGCAPSDVLPLSESFHNWGDAKSTHAAH